MDRVAGKGQDKFVSDAPGRREHHHYDGQVQSPCEDREGGLQAVLEETYRLAPARGARVVALSR
jgi:hypothetical protein